MRSRIILSLLGRGEALRTLIDGVVEGDRMICRSMCGSFRVGCIIFGLLQTALL
jgi:hypothetical protein